jgi:hypothetical protein
LCSVTTEQIWALQGLSGRKSGRPMRTSAGSSLAQIAPALN